MPSQIVSKKIDSSRIVWFSSSNQWVHLEEPAWYVYTLHQKSSTRENIARKCTSRYGLNTEESVRFSKEILSALAELEKPSPIRPETTFSPNTINQLSFTPYSTRYYRMKNKYISVTFGSKTAEYYIHPPFAHLQTDIKPEADAHFEIFENENTPVLRKKDDPKFSLTANEYSRLKRTLYIELTNIIYQKTNSQWMSYLHASGISNGKETILLSSASGSGKSTMAALLQAKGFRLVSDDFVPIDASTKRAWPFPAAVSVKKGAFPILSPFYGNIQDNNYNLYPFTHSSIRYLHPQAGMTFDFKPRPVKKMIFIHYNPEVDCSLAPLPVPQALKLFHEQAWVSHNPSHARKFINWFVKLECFRLDYSDNGKGTDLVKSLFSDSLEHD